MPRYPQKGGIYALENQSKQLPAIIRKAQLVTAEHALQQGWTLDELRQVLAYLGIAHRVQP